MSEQTIIADTPTFKKKSPSNKKTGKQSTPSKKENSPSENEVQKHGNLKQSELIKWTIFVRPEVKTAVQKAAKKRSITDTAWLDERLWNAATDELTKKAQPPIKTEDVADILKRFTDTMQAGQEAIQAEQAATLKAQNDLIQQQGQQIAALADVVQKNQPKSIKEMLFGKGKGN